MRSTAIAMFIILALLAGIALSRGTDTLMLGILTPGGSIIGLPIVATLYKSGVGTSILMTYATSFALLSILRIPIEVGFIGRKLAGLRVAVSLFLPLLAGFSTQLLLPLIERP